MSFNPPVSLENGFIWKSLHVTECCTDCGLATFQSPCLNTLDLYVSNAVLEATFVEPRSSGECSNLLLKECLVSVPYLYKHKKHNQLWELMGQEQEQPMLYRLRRLRHSPIQVSSKLKMSCIQIISMLLTFSSVFCTGALSLVFLQIIISNKVITLNVEKIKTKIMSPAGENKKYIVIQITF